MKIKRKKIIHDIGINWEGDLSTAIQESCNQLDEEYCVS